MKRIVVRPLQRPSEFEGAEEVQLSAWGENERAVTPKEILIAMHDNGGLALGAFQGKKVVGFAIQFPGYNGKSVYQYSHMTGVLKEYQSKGVGYLLKQKQREFSLERGFNMIAWTFDPLIARNSYFNFVKLGVVCRNYIVDYYGPMRDPVNRGLPTDRFLCEWFIEPAIQERVRAYSRVSLRQAHEVIEKGGEAEYPICKRWEVDLTAAKSLVDIPPDIGGLKARNLRAAQRWRSATRDIFRRYFAAGFTAVALLKRSAALQYLMMKADLPEGVFPERPE